MSVSSDEFTRWREDRVTQWVFASLAMTAEENKDDWLQRSWEGGMADPMVLVELKTRADAYRAIIDAPYEAHCETNGDERDAS